MDGNRKRFGRGRPVRRKAQAEATPRREVDLDITGLGARGDGIGRHDGAAVYVPYAVPGDRLRVRIEGRRGDGFAASLLSVAAAGKGRVEPACPHFGQCGGCALQHLSESAYATWKVDQLQVQLARQGFAEAEIAPLVRVPPGTRRRAVFAFRRRRGRALVGFNARASREVVDIADCLLLDPLLVDLLEPLRAVLAATATGDGDVVVNRTDTGLDVLIDGAARLDLADRERLADFAERADLARLSWRRPDSGLVEPIATRRPATVQFRGVAVAPPPGAFLQATAAGEAAIVDRVLAALGAAAPVADLYAGCGSITLPLAANGRAVHAVEGEEGALDALMQAARRRGLAVTGEVRDLARQPLVGPQLASYEAVVFDPPRGGARAQAEELAVAGPPVVVAVSCNPATLARDVRLLVDGGYRLEKVTPIDQFTYSAHLEAAAILFR